MASVNPYFPWLWGQSPFFFPDPRFLCLLPPWLLPSWLFWIPSCSPFLIISIHSSSFSLHFFSSQRSDSCCPLWYLLCFYHWLSYVHVCSHVLSSHSYLLCLSSWMSGHYINVSLKSTDFSKASLLLDLHFYQIPPVPQSLYSENSDSLLACYFFIRSSLKTCCFFMSRWLQ